MTEYRKSLIYTILFLLLITTFAIYDIRSGYLKELSIVRSRVANTSFLIQEWVESSFKASHYVLLDLVSQISLNDLQYPQPDQARQIKITKLIKSKLATLPKYFIGVGTADKNCMTAHTYNKPPRSSTIGFDGSKRDWCTSYKNNDKLEEYITPSFKSNTGNLAVIQNHAFRNISGKFYGMVGLELELSFFQKWLNKITIGKHGVITIVDTNMNLLARKPLLPKLIGKRVNDKILKEFLSSSENFKMARKVSSLDNENRVYGARKISGLPFVIIVGEADQDWLREWREKTAATVFSVIIFWILSILILRNNWKLLQLHEELNHQAHTDVLTGISNRRSFMNRAEQELKRVKRHQTQMALLLLDIDHFKLINDNNGHATGDRALVEFTKACQKSIRDIDILGRLGGDEFVILLLNTEIEKVRIIAERIRLSIASCEFSNDEGETISMTSSIGVAIVDSKISSVKEMLDMADAALYLSKEKGRNRVEFA